MIDYNRIASAINYIRENSARQSSLEEIAAHVHLSPFHFQRIFKDWAGVTPKKFLQYISLEHAKKLLERKYSIADATEEAGLSGTGRLHDLFITLEGMTPGEYKNEGESLLIHHSYAETPFGNVLIASTPKGICHLSFADDPEEEIELLHQRFAKATFTQKTDMHQQNALQIFKKDWSDLPQVKLHLKG